MLKLSIELVPSESWSKSLKRLARPSSWNKLRQKVYAEYNNKCGICIAEGRLNCHEVWQYDDQNHVQRLVGFIALCDLCHSVKHIGRTELLPPTPKDYYEMAVEHFMRVNECDRSVFDRHKKEAFVKWHERSRHEWKIDFGEYQDMFRRAE